MSDPTPAEAFSLALAELGEPQCGHVVGPVWKLDGESWACQRREGHEGDHAASDGTWWVHSVCKPEVSRA